MSVSKSVQTNITIIETHHPDQIAIESQKLYEVLAKNNATTLYINDDSADLEKGTIIGNIKVFVDQDLVEKTLNEKDALIKDQELLINDLQKSVKTAEEIIELLKGDLPE